MSSATELLAALERFLEAAAEDRKTRALAPIERKLKAAMAAAFRSQRREFLRRFAKPKPKLPAQTKAARPRHLREAVGEEWEPFFDLALHEGIDAMMATIEESAAAGVQAGITSALTELAAPEVVAEAAAKLGISFDLKNPRAVAYLQNYGALRVASINSTTRDYLRTVITQAVDEGWSYQRTAKAITDRYREFAVGSPLQHIESRAELIAVTECFPGNTLVGPAASHSGPVGGLALGGSHPLFRGGRFGPWAHAPILWASRRWFDGYLIEITTTSGNKLAGTPNHPVLTDRGWVALGALKEGDYVISDGRTQEVGLSDPDVLNMPTPIGEVFDALCNTPGFRLDRIHGVDMDFHGDGRKGQVEIVRPNRDLRSELVAFTREPVDNLLFTGSHLGQPLLPVVGASSYRGGAFLAPSPHPRDFGHPGRGRRMGISEGNVALLSRSFGPHGAARLGHVTEGYFCPDEDSLDPVIGNTVAPGDALAGFTTGVTRDRICSINRLQYSGHVYNLHTINLAYMANGIVAHNCGEAYEHGNMLVAQDLAGAGLDMEKSWLIVGDERVDEPVCGGNAAEDWIPLDQAFASGHQHPLGHPGCRCTLLSRMKRERGVAEAKRQGGGGTNQPRKPNGQFGSTGGVTQQDHDTAAKIKNLSRRGQSVDVGNVNDHVVNALGRPVTNRNIILLGQYRDHYLKGGKGGPGHPEMEHHEHMISKILREPDEVHRSKKDPHTLIFYSQAGPTRYYNLVVSLPPVGASEASIVKTFHFKGAGSVAKARGTDLLQEKP
ncbi:MAG: hypothetical protein NTZ05_20225 [Chloroflexi bacterium]|nr:hypothetical protein [Chloroflexota bacterium]